MSISDDVRALEERYLEKQRGCIELADCNITLVNSLRDFAEEHFAYAHVYRKDADKRMQERGWAYWNCAIRVCDVVGLDAVYIEREVLKKNSRS